MIPFIVIVFANAIIIISLARHSRRLLNIRHLAMNGRTVPDDQLRQVTLMCLATSAVFLLCTAPGIILLIGKVNWSLPNGANVSYGVCSFIMSTAFHRMCAQRTFSLCLTTFRTTTGVFEYNDIYFKYTVIFFITCCCEYVTLDITIQLMR